MTHLTALTAAQAADRLASWQLALRAENKSPLTVRCYTDGARRYLAWCATHDHPPMSRASLNGWISHMLDARAAPATARIRQQAVRRFAGWLTAGGELPADPFPGVKAPRVDPPVVEPLTDAELRALLIACTGSGSGIAAEAALHDRRDEVIIRLMLETAIRSGEVVTLEVGDVDLTRCLVTIRRGKGGRGRVIPIGPATNEALRRYLTLRAQHPLAASPDLWLGSRGRRFGYEGLGRALRRRAKRAGIADFRPHRLRHTAAHRWLSRGGSESGLMAIAGWTRTDMPVRYTRARASERAAEEAWRLNLGNL